MTLAALVRRIEEVALAQPTVRLVVPNDVFALNAIPDAEYGVFAWTQGQHSGSLDSYATGFRFTFFYVDRLTDTADNRLEIQSVGIDTLTNILRTLGRELDIEAWTFTTFNQKFADLCAGVYCSVTINAPVDTTCAETTCACSYGE